MLAGMPGRQGRTARGYAVGAGSLGMSMPRPMSQVLETCSCGNLACRAAIPGQGETEHCAPGGMIAGNDTAAVAFDDAVGDGESQACAFPHRLGGEEGVEEMAQGFVGNAGAVIVESQAHFPLAQLAADLKQGRGLRRGGLQRVLHQVHHHLLQLARRAAQGEFLR